jgi:tetrahydromethanopterin S-methyltransferase subunit G
MNAVILTQEQYNEIITRIDEIKSEIKGTQSHLKMNLSTM